MAAVFAFAYIVGTVSTLVESQEKQELDFQAMMHFSERFMSLENFPVEFKNRVFEFYSYKWSSARGYNGNYILNNLPDTLRDDINIFMARGIVSKASLFKDLDPIIVNQIVARLKKKTCAPAECLFHTGDIARAIWFIQNGQVEILAGYSVNKDPSKSREYSGKLIRRLYQGHNL